MSNDYIFLIMMLIIFLFYNSRPMFIKEDFNENMYPFYRDPYSISLWKDTIKRHRWWNIFHKRKYGSLNNHIYVPSDEFYQWIK
jgi:hypothetical protein